MGVKKKSRKKKAVKDPGSISEPEEEDDVDDGAAETLIDGVVEDIIKSNRLLWSQ